MESADQAFPPEGQKKRRPKLGIAFALLPISAIILAVVGIWYTFTSWNFYSNGQKVQGTVVRLEESSDSDGTTYSPVFSYTVDGKQYEYESVNSSNPPSNQVGDVVTLLYDPNHPERARQNSFWELWLLPAILCPVSIVMLFLSIGIPLLVRRIG
ncbi:MAG TPA: DUF3592 domain-containing protein [Anaerolineales bacterium]|nr:DUF3592 domain-containing protein [Anaerolineales bacterium]